MAGGVLDQISASVDVTIPAQVPQFAQAAANLAAKGFERPKGIATRWQESRNDTGRRAVLSLVEDSAEGALPYHKSFEAYRAHQGALDYNGLSARALQVAKLMQPQPAGSPDELRAESVKHMSVGMGKVDGSKPEELTVAAMVILRRYIAGVPVLGSGGEARVVFDVDGTLTEVDLPLSRYSAGAPSAAAAVKGRPRVQRMVQRAGFDRLPTRAGESVNREGKSVNVEALECGYYDDGEQAQLKRGCIVQWRGQHAADRQFVEDAP
jgi:hypothetical protein